MIRALKPYLMMSFAMVSFLSAEHSQADEAPIQELDFFLFLADSIVKEGILITPLDLEDVEISDSEKALHETENKEEAKHE